MAFLPPGCWGPEDEKHEWHGTLWLQEELVSPWKSFLVLLVLNPFPIRSWKWENDSSLSICKTWRTKATLPCHRGPDPQSQGPWEFSFAFSPASQSVYFTCLFNIYMNQGNIISQKTENLASLIQTFGQGRKKSQLRIWLVWRIGICSYYPVVSCSKLAWLEELNAIAIWQLFGEPP